jgi:hypothetical protein
MSANDTKINDTKQLLINKYGILLSIQNMADVLHRQPGGLRKTLENPDAELTKKLNPGRRKVGRRVLYCCGVVAALVDDVDYAPEQEVMP